MKVVRAVAGELYEPPMIPEIHAEIQATNLGLSEQQLRFGYKEISILKGDAFGKIEVRGI